MKEAILKEDIRSNCKGTALYGGKGSKVKIVADRDPVMIVELKGERFPVHVSKLLLQNFEN